MMVREIRKEIEKGNEEQITKLFPNYSRDRKTILLGDDRIHTMKKDRY